MKYLFLHIPKSGGSYIHKAKEDKIISDSIVTPYEYSNGLRWHMSFIPGSEIYANPKTDFALSYSDYDCIQSTPVWSENPKVFTVLRDPWTTLWSLFCHNNFDGFDNVNKRVNLYSFHKFIDWFTNDKNEWGINSINTPFKKDLYYQCYNKDKEVMADISINFDTLNSSLEKFFKEIGCLNKDLPQEKIRQGMPFDKECLYDKSRFNLVGDKYYNSFNKVKNNSLFI
tara:strand:- start:71 stop:751 length:681 start_codon:yes stop_codon:yes gene_type:complete